MARLFASALVSLVTLPAILAAGGGLRESYLPTQPEEESSPMHRELMQKCLNKKELDWGSSPNGAITLNGNPFQIKGISWFGFEKGDEMIHGLNKRPLADIMDFVAGKFNVIRLPYSVNFALSDLETKKPKEYDVGFGLQGKTSIEVMDAVIDEAAKKGVFIMLDQHDIQGDKAELWYEGQYTEADAIKAWEVMLDRYSNRWNVFAADIRNEPHGIASWGDENPATDYNKYYERAINQLADKYPDWKGLWLVEGTQYNNQDYEEPVPEWWGGNLEGAKNWPVKLKSQQADSRLIYAPHIYGPSVYEHGYMKEPDFPNNMGKIWEEQYGWIVPTLKKGVIIGEWGGSCIGKDKVVQYLLGDWLKQKCMANNVWWALNPGSDDTGGLLGQDWVTIDWVKMNLLNAVQPNFSKMNYQTDDQICIEFGAPPNPACHV